MTTLTDEQVAMMCDDKKKMTAKTVKTYEQELLEGSYAQMRQIDELTAERDALHDENARLRDALEWLTNLGHGVGKRGGTPEAGEFEDALRLARKALDGDA